MFNFVTQSKRRWLWNIYLSSELLSTAIGQYLAQRAVQRFVLSHELIQENFEGVDPHSDWRLSPVPLLLPHGLLQDVLKQSIEVFVADTLSVVHLGRKKPEVTEGMQRLSSTFLSETSSPKAGTTTQSSTSNHFPWGWISWEGFINSNILTCSCEWCRQHLLPMLWSKSWRCWDGILSEPF